MALIIIHYNNIVHLQSSNFLMRWGATFDRGIFTTHLRIFPVCDVTLVSCDVAGKNKEEVFQPQPTSLTARRSSTFYYRRPYILGLLGGIPPQNLLYSFSEYLSEGFVAPALQDHDCI